MVKRNRSTDGKLSAQKRNLLRQRLLAWYQTNRRVLPWRDAPTPYGVWVSEIMLQQTRVEVVHDFYTRWMKAFPDVASLAKAGEDDVLALWQGLGYYSRARRLRAGAEHVVRHLGGQLPRDPESLQKIPGIGPYSAGAISSIAFGEASPIVDGNVVRVLTRIFALAGDPNKAPLKKTLWALAGELVPTERAGDFNQALMEFGALVCTPKSPGCHVCPLRGTCDAYDQGKVAEYPHLPRQQRPTALSMVVVSAWHRGSVAVEKLSSDARWWAGLYALPFSEVALGEKESDTARRVAQRIGITPRGEVDMLPGFHHAVTRFKINLTVAVIDVSRRGTSPHPLRWVPEQVWSQIALPAPHRKALGLAISSRR